MTRVNDVAEDIRKALLKADFGLDERVSQQTKDVNWTSYVRSIYVLCLRGCDVQKLSEPWTVAQIQTF